MSIDLGTINWIELDVEVKKEMKSSWKLTPLNPGLEAEVGLLETDNGRYVVKLWNKESRPDIRRQYHLLKKLSGEGIRVSLPHGWGRDVDGNQALLMAYGGEPVQKLDKALLADLTAMLADVHRFDANLLKDIEAPSYDFISYFFPSIDSNKDIGQILERVMPEADYRYDALIHGDYNLNNVLIQEGKPIIIDWTNGQMGDARYDVAWSVLLVKVFVGERFGKLYEAEFHKRSTLYSGEASVIFEAIAALRLVLLNRSANLLRQPAVLKRIHRLIDDNAYLTGLNLL